MSLKAAVLIFGIGVAVLAAIWTVPGKGTLRFIAKVIVGSIAGIGAIAFALAVTFYHKVADERRPTHRADSRVRSFLFLVILPARPKL